jgi:hypothetical protein
VSINHTRSVLLSLAVFVVLTVAHLWPMPSAPRHWSRVEGDGALNIWAAAWVGHTLVHAPARLFDGNIFYPEERTLAFSEAMLVQGAVAAPIMAIDGDAVLAYNVSSFAGFVLTGWAFCLLVRRWTGSWPAGYVAGSLAAFNAFTLVQLTHLQFLHTEFIAVILFGLDSLIVRGRWRDAAILAAGFVLNVLTSIYLMVFSVWLLLFACLARAGELLRGGASTIGRLAAAGALAALLLLPYLGQYALVNRSMGFVRGADEQQAASAANYASTGSRVHFERWSRDFNVDATSNTFPGFAALLLIAFAVSDRVNTADPRLRMCAAAAVGCAAVSFAPLLPFYRALHESIPLFQAVRVLPHIGEIVLLMVAVLAGFGMAALARAWGHAPGWPVAVIAVLVLVNGEALRAPIGYTWFEGVPEVYDVLSKEPAAIVAEAPFPIPQQWFLNAPYMVNATRHWRPILNGYSGFRPPSYERSYGAMRGFPSDESLLALSKLDVTHIVVHQRAMNHGAPDHRYNPYENVGSLHLLARDEDVLIYRLVRH